MPDINVDLIGRNGGVGELASYLAANGRIDVSRLKPFVDERTGISYISIFKGGDPALKSNYVVRRAPLNINGTLRRDEWKQLDDALYEISRYRLGGIQDLIDKGLTYNLGNAMGTTILEWHDVSDAMEAELTMDGVSRGTGDRVKFQYNYLPIPILHVDYEINSRALAASRSLGNPLDTTSVERAGRKILEKLENMLFTNTTYAYGEKDERNENKIYSYVNFPDRNLVNLSIPWNHSAITAAGILQDVLEMKQTSINAYHYGPWMLYIPTAYETILDDDYDTQTPGTTIRERILKIAGITGIKVVDTLAEHNVLLVQMTKDTVRLVRGMGLTNVEMKTEFDMVHKYKVMTIQVPQIRSDQNGKCGIVHLA